MEFVLDPGYELNLKLASQGFLQDIAQEIAADARALAPIETGALKTGITVDRGLHPGIAYVHTGRDVPGEDPNVPLYIEYGHRIVAWGHETGKFEPAQPYMRPALYQVRA